MIQIRNLHHQYKNSKSIIYPDFNLQTGEILVLKGDSGTGKSTLLYILAGILAPSSGNILINEHNLYAQTESQRDIFRSKNIGVIFQQLYLIPYLTVYQNIKLALDLAGNKVADEEIFEILKALHIQDFISNKASTLSHGMQQRVAIARAIINKPTWILADEPTSSLDDKNTESVCKLFQEINQKYKIGFIIASHDSRLKSYFPKQYILAS